MASFHPPHVHEATGSAPGRLDFLGGIADYSGALVLQIPVEYTARVRIRCRHDNRLIATSCNEGFEQVVVPYDCLEPDSRGLFNAWREHVSEQPHAKWAGYVFGSVAILMRERGIRPSGLEISVDSSVPSGKGLSSSAALEVATLRALGELFTASFTGTDLAKLAQQAENEFVGAPCGLMDQLASHHGLPNAALPILCRPDTLGAPLTFPEGIGVVGIDSGVRHEVTGADYATVRTASFMAYALHSKNKGITPDQLKHARQTGDFRSLPYGGYLSAMPEPDARDFPASLANVLRLEEFLANGVPCPDPFSTPQVGILYPVRAAAALPLQTHQDNSALVASWPPSHAPAQQVNDWLEQAGTAMFRAHEAYSRCGLGHQETDTIVDVVRERGPQAGLFGARITGGGCGGTVAVLYQGQHGFRAVQQIAQTIRKRQRGGGTIFPAISLRCSKALNT